MTSIYWPPAHLVGRGFRELARAEWKIWTTFVEATPPFTDHLHAGAIFVSDGSSGLSTGTLYYKFPNNGAIIDLTAGGGGGGVSSIGPVISTPIAFGLSIAGGVLSAHVADSTNYGFVKGKTDTTTTLGDNAGSNATGQSIVVGNGAGVTLVAGIDNVILGGDVNSAAAFNRIVLGNITGTVDDQLSAPVNSLQLGAGFLTQTETDVLTISAAGLVRKTPIGSIVSNSTFVNPILDHSAVGDGVADDTVAIAASIDDAQSNGKLLYLPKGTFRLTSTISKAIVGLSIFAHGEAQISIDHTNDAFTFTGDNFSMQGGHFVVTGGPSVFELTVNTVNLQNILVESDGSTPFVKSAPSSELTILNCTTDTSLDIGSSNVLVASSAFNDILIRNNAVGVCITRCACSSVSTSTSTSGNSPIGLSITDCTINPTGGNAGITIYNGDTVNIINNVIDASLSTGECILSLAAGVGKTKDAVVISKNMLINSSAFGISSGGAGAMNISLNTIIDNTGSAIQILPGSADELVINGNIIKGTHTSAISLPLVIPEFIIVGNKLSGGVVNSTTSATKVITNNVV